MRGAIPSIFNEKVYFHREERGSRFLRNVDKNLPDYTVGEQGHTRKILSRFKNMKLKEQEIYTKNRTC
jgi:16S rRNA C1402 N4-methylase RsmH